MCICTKWRLLFFSCSTLSEDEDELSSQRLSGRQGVAALPLLHDAGFSQQLHTNPLGPHAISYTRTLQQSRRAFEDQVDEAGGAGGEGGAGGPEWGDQGGAGLQEQGVGVQPATVGRGRLLDDNAAQGERRGALPLRGHARDGGHPGHRQPQRHW